MDQSQTKKPSGMELMASNLLRALGIDPEKLTAEFTHRIEQFEQGLTALNNSLVQINQRQERTERMLLEILSRLEKQGSPASVREPATGQIEHGAAASHAAAREQPQP